MTLKVFGKMQTSFFIFLFQNKNYRAIITVSIESRDYWSECCSYRGGVTRPPIGGLENFKAAAGLGKFRVRLLAGASSSSLACT